MSEPIEFETVTPRHALPMLAAGQAQKEFFVNEAFARIDALLHPVIEGQASDPPAAPQPGQNWLVTGSGTGDWTGRDGSLANWDGFQWTYLAPAAGMLVYDGATGERLCFRQTWKRAERPTAPAGGAVVDTEARAAIGALLDLFATLAMIPEE